MSFDNFFDEPKFDYESEKKKFIQNLNFLKENLDNQGNLMRRFQR